MGRVLRCLKIECRRFCGLLARVALAARAEPVRVVGFARLADFCAKIS